MTREFRQEDVLELWFPETGHERDNDSHSEFWTERMQGGMDERICARFGGLTEAAARGCLDHWADTPYGRLALLIALDQFPRSVWRDTPGAFAQDIKATRLALEGIENGHYAALDHAWEKQFYLIAMTHCEGPDHLSRCDKVIALSKDLAANDVPPQLDRFKELSVAQAERVRGVIARFGRHPHRNPILGRLSTPEEEAYIAEGNFPHLPRPEVETS